MAFHAELGRCGGCLPDMIRLHRTLGDDHVGPGILGRGHQEFQLAGLVAACGKPCAVITLDPQARTAKRRRQTRHFLKRCRLMTEMNSSETG